jgi:uncharacterized protein DUF5916
MRCIRVAAWLVLGGLILSRAGEAGQSAPTESPSAPLASLELPFAFDGPPPPVPPAVLTRDDSGRATMRAVHVTVPLRIDGQLDEVLYTSVPPASDFTQIEPQAGLPATEKTEVWVTFDRAHVYVSVRCWASQPERIIANEMRRDVFIHDDYVDFIFDTFYDRRNAVDFTVNPIGGRMDGQITDERQYSIDWNPVWDVAVGRFDGGWTFEAAIPFKSLRYRPGRAQIWGFQIQRYTQWKNEISTLTRLPAALGHRGTMQVSLAATLVGLEAPPGSKNLEIKPYLVSDVTSDLIATPSISNEVGGDVGIDVKYGLTQNLTADFTYNTDFAQVEADEQQIDLTRFSLFFPEKREFFLENQGTFAFGGAATGLMATTSDTPILFYSRRIGLSGGRAAPIDAGGRLTGRIGHFTLGLLNIQSDDAPLADSRATNFSVVRLKRDILRRSSVGVIYTGRSVGQGGISRNDAYGLDGTFAFFDNLAFNTYWAQTRTPGLSDQDTSYRLQMDYAGDRYGVQLERLMVGDHFNPEVGFLRRDDMRRSFGLFRYSPRPPRSKLVRKYSWTGSLAYIENGTGRLETRDSNGEFGVEFHNGDRFTLGYGRIYEFLPQPFRIAAGVTLPVRGYDFDSVRSAFSFGQQRRVSGNVSLEHGTFYSGHKTTMSVSRGRVNLSPQLSVEPSFSVNWVDLVEGAFTTELVGSRVTYTMTPRMFVSALLQYNSGNNTVAANVRLRWEYRPGSEIFLVFNEQRDTLARDFPGLANRALILKINRLFRL